ncbi:unnamed protein product [Cuscuta campestris]|uniref:Uncharacterized protein n=1 Tax=Cuscuta campestris TaxID=132261 RepID=A0A484N8K2_9ASTE|nr:unnamed protein product [Cuscuta campestris]
MAALPTLLIAVLVAHLCNLHALAAHSPAPAPAPQSGPHADSPPPVFRSPSPSPSDAADRAPPAPPPLKFDVSASPALAPDPDAVNDVSHADVEEASGTTGGGMSRGRKAGIAVGVIAGACVVGIGAVVYKKRQRNILRSRYGYGGEREMV